MTIRSTPAVVRSRAARSRAAAAVAVCVLTAAALGACGTERASGDGDGGAVVDPAAVVPTPTTPPCPPEGISVSPGLIDAAMGLRAGNLDVTNCGDEPVTLNGYPELTVLDADGEPLDIEVTHRGADVATVEGFDDPPADVTIAPGERARAGLLWRNTYTDTTRDPDLGVTVLVVPAAGASEQSVTPDGGIDLGSTGLLAVSPWRAVE
ncbi:DUF4232 domain-containing protein [Streptomyces sp. RFCAC02]|uniref:DUF4232 domain-containing protein n=1 Tax=Streptomyces sp. RFCAC02 TaxID=2499143 RepID=UPI00101FF009|nr:DUF4232 domain-containing protein [Streptomyces sp. RFCAC02]